MNKEKKYQIHSSLAMMIIVFKIMKVDNNYEIKKNTRFKFCFGNDNNCL